MKIKKKYVHNNNRQIFRILPSNNDKLVIEERNIEKKQAYFNCLNIVNGKKFFKNLQLDEKFWIGIETVHNDVILFHKFRKPDMPQHLGVLAFDINKKKIIWENAEHTFLFVKDGKVFTFQQLFEQREYFTLNVNSGEVVDKLGTDFNSINVLREEVSASEDFSSYHFPITFVNQSDLDQQVVDAMQKVKEKNVITGKIEYVLKEELLMFNFHKIEQDNSLNNSFKAVDLTNGNYILERVLNVRTNAFVPDSFFLKDNMLFLLIEKTKLEVYTIIN
ncbi:MAG: DUF4905 domain-containing protein [Ignavibacterium sp.]|nr:MAG: DUF4905 domain-containing protein [Ignavibacterium sp.]